MLNPEAPVVVRDRLRGIRNDHWLDHELKDEDETWAVVDNAWRLRAKLVDASQELDEHGRDELELFTDERLVEASLRYP